MQIMHTKYGFLPIAEKREELDSWNSDALWAWLRLNDPDGAWEPDDIDFVDFDEDALRGIVWEQSQGVLE